MAIVDQYGKEIRRNKPILDEIAVQTVRDRYSTYPSHGLTAERLAAILKEADQGHVLRQSELFEEMEEKDAHLGAELSKRKLSVSGLSWDVLPATDSVLNKDVAAKAKEVFEYFEGLDEAVLDMLDAVGKGFSLLENMWQISEGQVWIQDIKYVHQKRCTFSAQDRLLDDPRLLTDAEPVWGEELPPGKFVYFRHRARSGAAPRGGLLRPCAYMYLFKNYDIKDWLIFNELFSVPMRVGKYKTGASKDEIEKLKQAVFNLGTDAAAVISDGTVIELLESAQRTNSSGFKDLAEFCDKSMTKAILGHTGSSEGTPGKLGSEDQARDLRQDLLEADARAVERAMRHQVLAPWTAYTYGPGVGVPKFKLRYEGEEDLEKIATIYGTLVNQVQFDGIPKAHIYDRFSIPQPKEGEAVIKPAAASPFGGLSLNKGCECGQAHKADAGTGRRGDAEVQIKGHSGLKDKDWDKLVEQSLIPALERAGARNVHTHDGKEWDKIVEQNLIPALRRAGELSLMIHKGEEWIAKYMQYVAPEMQRVRKSAVVEVERWLNSLSSPPTQQEFIANVQRILGSEFSKVDKKAVSDAVSGLYRFYLNADPAVAGAQIAFGGADQRAVDFLTDVDHLFHSKFVSNPDSQAAINQFLEERYLAGGEGLFGRGDPAAVEELTNLLSQKMTEISEYQVNRIVDTSVQRIRNYAHIGQLKGAGILEIEIYEPTQDCPFCAAMHGQVISVDLAFDTMQAHTDMKPEEYEAMLKNTQARVENVSQFVGEGRLPPYHPYCKGRVIKRVKR